MPLPNLPVETWRGILEESIALPTFLDVDCLPEVTNPLFQHGWDEDYCNNYPAYWETERRRNLLRRVCKSWNTHLLKFEHRYVQISDVFHHNIPEEALAKAIRIAFRPCADYSCSTCFGEVNTKVFTNLEQLSAHIIDDRENSSPTILQTVVRMHTKMPELRAIIMGDMGNVKGWHGGLWVPLFSGLPLLRYGHFEVSMVGQWTDYPGRNLVNLSVSAYDQAAFSILEKCDFSALQHFSVHILAPEFDGLWRFLKTSGRNLRSLLLGCSICDLTLPEGLWDLCPRIERFDTSVRIPYFPSPNHPLHTMSYSMSRPAVRGPPIPFDSDIKNFSSLRRLICQHGWGLELAPRTSKGVNLHWTRALFEQCTRYGVILEDINGVMFVDSRIGGRSNV